MAGLGDDDRAAADTAFAATAAPAHATALPKKRRKSRRACLHLSGFSSILKRS
jgi:hypothetical protein